MKKKHIGIVAGSIAVLILILLIGPIDIFSHGYYCDEIDVEQIADADKLGLVDLDDPACIVEFTPLKLHFAGVELYLAKQPQKSSGVLTMAIYNDSGKQLDEVRIPLDKVKASSWYKVYTNTNLTKNKKYTLKFSVSGSASIPAFMLVDEVYLPDESNSGDILINYAYSESTFSFQEKTIIIMFILALWGMAGSCFLADKKLRKYVKTVISFMLLSAILSWNYMYSSINSSKTTFLKFQVDSETLVTGAIHAARDGLNLTDKNGNHYGLGRYCNLIGVLEKYGLEYLSDNNWQEGYSKTMPVIIVNSNDITKKIAVVGNYIQFKNGEEYRITDIVDDEITIKIELDADQLLSSAKNGSLDDTVFFDSSHKKIDKSLVTVYESQYGLQGRLFGYLAKHISEENTLEQLHLFCALITAFVFVVIVILINSKYNPLLAGCFYFTFLLSPWIINFARNLYWVEFTWFIPMAVGLLCSWKVASRKWRIFCYISAFIAITCRCLCGYEYISVIMMGLISFMVIDLLLALQKKEKKHASLLFKTTLILGIIALTGFMTAICIHASLKGNGSITEGIKNIIEDVALRRTNKANLNDFDSLYWPSINASVWEVYSMYFHFPNDVIIGITGNLFPLLCLIPIGIFINEYKNRKIDFETIFMYIFFFLASISWFCLGKSHSYNHTHINFVLWYFGFVQTCFYIIISRIVSVISPNKNNVETKHRA